MAIIDNFNIKEYVGLKNYNWQNSVVKFDTAPFHVDNTVLTGNAGEIDYQMTSDGKIAFITDLKSGEEKAFELIDGTPKKKTNIANISGKKIILENDNIKITVAEDTEEIFTIHTKTGKAYGKCVLSEMPIKRTLKIQENGSIFAEVKISIQLKNGEYTIVLTLEKQAEFIRIYEEINVDDMYMYMKWNEFEPTKHISANSRACQYINEYLCEDGQIPIYIVPFDATSGIVNSPYLTFYNKAESVALFIGDAEKWDDGSYAFEENNYINRIKTYYCVDNSSDKLVWKYPLNKGARETYIALYDSEEKIDTVFSSYAQCLQFKNVYVPLNEYKDWIFDYDDADEKYPICFDKNSIEDKKYYFAGYDGAGVPPADTILKSMEKLDIISNPWKYGPVWSRSFFELIAALDMRANEMKREDFIKCRNIFIFFAYLAMRENHFPTRHMCGGHANFMVDTLGIIGMSSAMFHKHPKALIWKEYYERVVAIYMKYQVRPDVIDWKAKSGRPTESIGTYMWCALRHIFIVSDLIKAVYNEDIVLHPNFVKLAKWLLNIMSPQINGRRCFPPMGAHAGGHMQNPFYPPFLFRIMGNKLKNYDPLVAEQIFRVCPAEPLVQHEAFVKSDFYSIMNKKTDVNNNGILPHLSSKKYTGFGYVMRSNENTDNEMCVLLQQIDEGPNYRWGSTCKGGCGNIYYWAGGKRYSDNRFEDVGDDIMTDGDVSCTFSVLVQQQTYKSVGKNDLINPFIDFDFIKYAKLNAGAYSNEEYCFRSVLMVSNDYIAVYDAVRDYKTAGRFSWFSNVRDELPEIYNIKPGVQPRKVNPPEYTLTGEKRKKELFNADVIDDTHGVIYNGRGDFFTVVTHKKDIKVEKSEFGVIIENENAKDYVFDSSFCAKSVCDDVTFSGSVGIVRKLTDGTIKMAIVDGNEISIGNLKMKIEKISDHFSIELLKKNGRYTGCCEGHGKVTISDRELAGNLYINENVSKAENGSVEFEINDCKWEITEFSLSPSNVEDISYYEHQNDIQINWEAQNCDKYEIEITSMSGQQAVYISDKTTINLPLDAGKYICRIRGINDKRDGSFSNEYPIYVTKRRPSVVEGVRISRENEDVKLTWGKQLGILEYRVYSFENENSPQIIYSGPMNEYTDKNCKLDTNYFVTAINDWGESKKSKIVNNEIGGVADWDPIPDVEFVRDTLCNEHGYAGFDYAKNERRQILKY